jgi:hypothetical protein
VKIGSYVSLNIGYEKSNVFSNISKITCNITNLIRDKKSMPIKETKELQLLTRLVRVEIAI